MKIYIAGKITGDETYREKFGFVAERVRNHGHIALDPSTLPEGMEPRDYMNICHAMIEAADLVIFLPDHMESGGAQIELDYCIYTHKPLCKLKQMSDLDKLIEMPLHSNIATPPTKYLATSIFFRCGFDEAWAQLAEEASELAHAALKMRRVDNSKNPTPIDANEALDNVFEEVNDLLATLDVLDLRRDDEQVRTKLIRWMERLTTGAGKETLKNADKELHDRD